MAMATVLDEVRARIPAVRGRMLRPLVRFREMRFPTFPPESTSRSPRPDDYFRYATLGLAVAARAGRGRRGRVRRGRRLARRDERLPAPARARPAALPVRHLRGLPAARPAARRRRHALPDTSEEAVRRRVGPSPKRRAAARATCRRRWPGLEDERFAFVLLDLDLLRADRARRSSSSTRACRPAATSSCTTTTTRSPTGPASGRSTPSSRTSPSRLVELGDVWGSALIRRVG